MLAGALNAAENAAWWKQPCVPKDLVQEVVDGMGRTIRPSSPGWIRPVLRWPPRCSAASAARSCARHYRPKKSRDSNPS